MSYIVEVNYFAREGIKEFTSIGECSSRLSSEWKELPDEEKKRYGEIAKNRKEGDLSSVSEQEKWKEIRASMNRISQEVLITCQFI